VRGPGAWLFGLGSGQPRSDFLDRALSPDQVNEIPGREVRSGVEGNRAR
jgi:hypothetical protein